jgi:hypothetical protein
VWSEGQERSNNRIVGKNSRCETLASTVDARRGAISYQSEA